MAIEKGLYAVVFFNDLTQIEGIVESWSDKESIIVAKDNQSKFIIFNTERDIKGVKIRYDMPVPKLEKKFEETVAQFKEVYQAPSQDELRTKNLAQLKSLMNEQEKKIIAERLKDHTPSNPGLPSYGLPSFISKPITKQRSSR